LNKKPPPDTSLGGGGDRFPETTGDVLSVVGKPGPLPDQAGLDVLCRRYWRPVYAYVRIAWAKSNEDAKDLTQAFFLWLFEGDALQRYDPNRGNFRAYLKTLLKRFVGHEDRALGRLKRGGHLQIVSLDGQLPTLPGAALNSEGADPEKVFEQVWLEQMLSDAVDRVRSRCAASGKALRFRIYEEFTGSAKETRPSYKELAERHGLKESDIENSLFVTREEIRDELRGALRAAAADAEEFEDEWKRLFGR